MSSNTLSETSENQIPFNKPFLSGRELEYIQAAVASGKISGDGMFTKKCHDFFETKFGFLKTLLTTSCTDALEMAAILINIEPGDEVLMPSYTFVSTANAFVLRGAKIVFADSGADNPNIDVEHLETLITDRTKAIVVVHYAGISCDMDEVMALADRHGLFVVEDAAQAVDSYYNGKPLGGIGHLSAFSFHETKNVIAGEGGMLVINDERFVERAEIIREKGTNRSKFFRGEIDKYSWVDIGSSFLPSDLIAAFLYAQLESLDEIQRKRKALWQTYYGELKALENAGHLKLPSIPAYATNNAHMFYVIAKDLEFRDSLIKCLKSKGINAVFHYLSLHKSQFYEKRYDGKDLPNCDFYANTLIRLPMFYELSIKQVNYVCSIIKEFYGFGKAENQIVDR